MGGVRIKIWGLAIPLKELSPTLLWAPPCIPPLEGLLPLAPELFWGFCGRGCLTFPCISTLQALAVSASLYRIAFGHPPSSFQNVVVMSYLLSSSLGLSVSLQGSAFKIFLLLFPMLFPKGLHIYEVNQFYLSKIACDSEIKYKWILRPRPCLGLLGPSDYTWGHLWASSKLQFKCLLHWLFL